MEGENIRKRNRRNKVDDTCYLARKIILPIFMMILFSIVLSTKIDLLDSTLFYFIKINLKNDSFWRLRIVKMLVAFTILWYFNNRRISKKEHIFAENIQGDFHKAFYIVSSLMGYRRVSLVHKPIPIQFYLMNSNIYQSFDTYENDVEILKKEHLEYSRKDFKGDTSSINICIFDTYPGDETMIPEDLKNNMTIVLVPNKKQSTPKRFFGKALIYELEKILKENRSQKNCSKYNLFLFTTPLTNKKIYESVFNTKSDNNELSIYRYDIELQKFTKKSIRVNC